MDHPYEMSQIWRALRPDTQRRLADALSTSVQTWRRFLVPPTTTDIDVVTFARRHLLLGFMERPLRILTAMTAVRVSEGIELHLAFAPHPPNIALPACGCGVLGIVQVTFGGATLLSAAEDRTKL
jgi:hypothetical protein